MKCSAFIATSSDGYIATLDGGVDWLHNAGNKDADMKGQEDMGFNAYIASIDCMIMGRKCMEVVSNMNLTAEQWPYGETHIIVLSNTLKLLPANMQKRAELYSGDLRALLQELESKGFQHAYIDGGKTIQSFLEMHLLDEITITKAPVKLNEGIPLFNELNPKTQLENERSIAFPNAFTQVKYTVNYGK